VSASETARIRRASADDAPALARLRYEFRASLAEPSEPIDAFLPRCADWMARRLGDDDRWRAWVAERDGRIVGTIWLATLEKMPNPAPEPEEYGYITNTYVIPSARGEGVGDALIGEAVRWCEERGVHAIVLWSTARSAPLYRRHGFDDPERLLERIVTEVSMPGAYEGG
jgi:GNAT superfamily N-acetyltransferase